MLDAPKAFAKDTDEQIAKWIADALQRPSSFGLWSEHPHYDEMFETWSLGPTIEHRDSSVLDRANAAALRKHLASDPTLADDYYMTEANHWAVGWVIHLSFRVLDENRELTRMARVVREWFDSLADYPVADESLYSEMETTEAEDCWTSWQARDVKRALVRELEARVECTDECMSHDGPCTCDSETREASIDEQMDSLDDETLWEIAVHNGGNGREIDSDGAYVIRKREIDEIASALLERSLIKI